MTDRLGMVEQLLAAVSAEPRRFAEIAQQRQAPAIARAYLLWHRRLGMALGAPLGDATWVCQGEDRR